MSSLKYWLWLTRLKGLRNQARLALLRQFGTPEDIFFAGEEELLQAEGMDRVQAEILSNHSTDEAERVLANCQRLNIDIVTMQDAAYPGRLRNIFDPPCLLYVKGRLPVIDEEAVVAVVGTRSCTPYGLACAERLSYELTSGGAIVVSGLARGVDAAASRGALRAGGITMAVVGSGLDVLYPRENASLYEDIASVGAVLSEYPPGTSPMGGNFPARNRILAGLSVAALVVEAPELSGALITARLALDQGRDVFAVPGPIDAPASRGCNLLIREGAGLITSGWDLLEEYAARFPDKLHWEQLRPLPSLSEERPPRSAPTVLSSDAQTSASESTEETVTAQPEKVLRVVSAEEDSLTDDQLILLGLMDPEVPILADDLIDRSGIPSRRVLSALTVLEIDGMILQHSGKRYTRLVRLRDS